MKILSLLVMLFGITITVFSAEKPYRCKANKSEDLLYCILEADPQLRLLKLSENQKGSLKKIAEQRRNPIVMSRILYGTGDSSLGAEINARHVFELGGKRSSRIARAEQKVSSFHLQRKITQQEVLSASWLKLNRVRQIEHEKELLEEAAKTYQQVRSRYRKFPRLSPEQQLGSDIFLFAAQENQEHIKRLKSEELILLQELSISTGLSANRLRTLLPKAISTWPIVFPKQPKDSLYIQYEQAKLKLSKAELEYQQAKAWPDLQLGPSVDINRSDSSSLDVGASIKITAPLYHQNQGEKEYARRGIDLARNRVAMVRKNIFQRRTALLAIYRNATIKLDTNQRLRSIESRHKRLHNLLRRGVVHTSLVIELHRQQFALITRAHENEVQAIEALWGIYAIDGKIFKEGK